VREVVHPHPSWPQRPMLPELALESGRRVHLPERMSSPSPMVLCTPCDAASTTWRKRVCPLAPARREDRHPLGSDSTPSSVASLSLGPVTPHDAWPSPAGTPMSQSRSSVHTPSDVPTTAWRRLTCPPAPVRHEGQSSTAPMWVLGPVPAPSTLWPAAVGTPMSQGSTPMSEAGSPSSVVLLAPEPHRLLAFQFRAHSSGPGTPSSGASISSGRWPSLSSASPGASLASAAAARPSPFCMEVAPAAAVAKVGRAESSLQRTGRAPQEQQPDFWPAPSSPVKLEAAPVEPRAPRTSGVPEWLRNLGA